ncbi:hypothetical protein [Rhodococcus sp. WY5]|uniref:hypothetical protein n=1 Tax=Rhodococcus sp. WY5 TaxID=2708349 RepID=UPI001BDF69AE|nr:hypothetical protein [Rhodococcus sp. WY5]
MIEARNSPSIAATARILLSNDGGVEMSPEDAGIQEILDHIRKFAKYPFTRTENAASSEDTLLQQPTNAL